MVRRRHDELLQQRVQDCAVARLPGLVWGVDGSADAGQIQVFDDVGVVRGGLAVPDDVVHAEAVVAKVSGRLKVDSIRDQRGR